MKLLIGLALAFVIGLVCRFFDIPVPSPPVLPGALLVVATTLGYMTADKLMTQAKPNPPAVVTPIHQVAPPKVRAAS